MEKVRLPDLPLFVRRVLAKLKPPDFARDTPHATIITLRGDLGAGKTTFVQALAHEVGIVETVQSPTYVLMKSYTIAYKHFTRLVHIDAYRLESPAQFAALKPEIFLSNKNALVCIEWPEKIEGTLPEPDVGLSFSADGAGEMERYIEGI